jgi:cysteinyl-tRNA synthetase
LEKFENLVEKINLELIKNQTDGVKPELEINQFEDKFIAAMDDDFNTAQAVAVIFDFVKEVNRTIAEKENIGAEYFKNVKAFLVKTAVDVLGIMNFDVEDKTANKDLDVNFIQQQIKRRVNAKNEKDYALADKIRDELKELGVELKDSKDGTTYKIVK